MASTFKLLVELPLTLVQEDGGVPAVVPTPTNGTAASCNVFDEIFLRNPTTGGYIRVFAEPTPVDADSRVLSQPCQLPIP